MSLIDFLAFLPHITFCMNELQSCVLLMIPPPILGEVFFEHVSTIFSRSQFDVVQIQCLGLQKVFN